MTDHKHAFTGHPQGLYTLFFTELWERFSYYGMRALLTLFMVAPVASGGLGYDTPRAAMVYGTYTMSVYMLSIPGGFIADNFLGARHSVLYGGIIIALGHFTLAIQSETTFFLGLVLIALGTGLLKPNISSMVGSLYTPEDTRRDAGFSIFYMGINIGAFSAPLVTGWLAQHDAFKAMLKGWGLNPLHSWHWGFAAAGVGMTVGLIVYLINGHRLGRVGLPPAANGPRPWGKLGLVLLGAAMLFGLVRLSDRVVDCSQPFQPVDLADLPGLASKVAKGARPVDVWLAGQLSDSTKQDLARAEGKASPRSDAPESLLNDLNRLQKGPSIYDTNRFDGVKLRKETLELLPPESHATELARLNRWLLEDAFPDELSPNRKPYAWISYGYVILPVLAIVFFGLRASLDSKKIAAVMVFSLAALVFWAIFEQAGSSISLFGDRLTRTELFGFKFPSAWFQSVNSLFVMLLAPVFAWLWVRLGDRQPSSPVKFVVGLVFLGLSFLLMVPAAKLTVEGLVSPMWIVGLFFLQTVGELCLSPVGLSTMTKLAPPPLLGLVMGIWFLAAALGNKVAGVLAGEFESTDPAALANFFLHQAYWVGGATVALLLCVPWLKKLMGGVK